MPSCQNTDVHWKRSRQGMGYSFIGSKYDKDREIKAFLYKKRKKPDYNSFPLDYATNEKELMTVELFAEFLIKINM